MSFGGQLDDVLNYRRVTSSSVNQLAGARKLGQSRSRGFNAHWRIGPNRTGRMQAR